MTRVFKAIPGLGLGPGLALTVGFLPENPIPAITLLRQPRGLCWCLSA